MADAPAMRTFLVGCMDSAAKVGFSLVDGREFLGWVDEVADDRVFVAWAPNPIYMQATGGETWSPDDEWIPFSAIRAETLAWYDTSAKRWLTYPD
ncbi:hypothetical protein [Phytohabitans rumicis]|nr:hypothetical protein [Phytohabitans rumicis]